MSCTFVTFATLDTIGHVPGNVKPVVFIRSIFTNGHQLYTSLSAGKFGEFIQNQVLSFTILLSTKFANSVKFWQKPASLSCSLSTPMLICCFDVNSDRWKFGRCKLNLQYYLSTPFKVSFKMAAM